METAREFDFFNNMFTRLNRTICGMETLVASATKRETIYTVRLNRTICGMETHLGMISRYCLLSLLRLNRTICGMETF